MSHIKQKFEIAIFGTMDKHFGRAIGQYFNTTPSMAHGRSIACKQVSNSVEAMKALESQNFDMVVTATKLPFNKSLTSPQSSLIPSISKYVNRQSQRGGDRKHLIMMLDSAEYRNYSSVLPEQIQKNSWRFLVSTMGADRVALAVASYIAFEHNELKAIKKKYPSLANESTQSPPY